MYPLARLSAQGGIAGFDEGSTMHWTRAARAVLALGAMLVLGGLVAACGGSAETVDPGALDGTWSLVSYRGAEGDVIESDPAIESQLTLDAGTSSGVGGVNTFSGTYEAGDDGTISFGAQASTLMAGSDAAMAQETGLYGALTDAARFAIDGDTMTLEDAEGETLATFTSLAE